MRQLALRRAIRLVLSQFVFVPFLLAQFLLAQFLLAQVVLASTAAAQAVSQNQEPLDALYRERGYGQGGLAFGLGRNDLGQAGACADLAFARLKKCGAQGRPGAGYGFYGNGLGQTFGW